MNNTRDRAILNGSLIIPLSSATIYRFAAHDFWFLWLLATEQLLYSIGIFHLPIQTYPCL